MEAAAPGTDPRKRSDLVDDSERRVRVKDLREMRRQWRNEEISNKNEQIEIFQVSHSTL